MRKICQTFDIKEDNSAVHDLEVKGQLLEAQAYALEKCRMLRRLFIFGTELGIGRIHPRFI